jgi:hypothetical protein
MERSPIMKTSTILPLLCLTGLLGCPETDPGSAIPTEEGVEGGSINDNPNNQSWRCTEDCVLLTGTVIYEGEQEGKRQLDFMVIEDDRPPERKHAWPMQKPPKDDKWEVKAPRDEVDGVTITVIGFLDLAGDGPSDGDPAGFDQVLIDVSGSEDEEPVVTGFDVVIVDNPDICTFPGESLGTATCDAESGQPVNEGEEGEGGDESADEEAGTVVEGEASTDGEAAEDAPEAAEDPADAGEADASADPD